MPKFQYQALAYVPVVIASPAALTESLDTVQQVPQGAFQYQAVAAPVFVPPASASVKLGWLPTAPDSIRAQFTQHPVNTPFVFAPAPAAQPVVPIEWLPRHPDYFPLPYYRQFESTPFVFKPTQPTQPVVPLEWLPRYPDYFPQLTYKQNDPQAFIWLPPAPVPSVVTPLSWKPVYPDFLLRPLHYQGLFPTLYGMGVLPPKPPPKGPGFGVNPPPPTVPTDFTKFFGVVVASPQGQKSLPYLIRSDDNQIAILDSNSSKPVDFAVYQCHTFTGGEANRDTRKKVVRILVFGEGHIPTTPYHAYMVVTADNARSTIYLYSSQSADPVQGLLWSQNALALTGRTIDITLFIAGASNLVIRDVQLQFTIVG